MANYNTGDPSDILNTISGERGKNIGIIIPVSGINHQQIVIGL